MPDAEKRTDLVLLGQFGAAHGLKGEVRLKSFTGDPMAIGDYGPLVAQDGRRFEITALRPAKEVLIARIKGVADRTAAERLTNVKLYAPREVLGELADEDEFFHADLVGLAVEDEAGSSLGRIVALYDFGAGHMVEVRLGGGSRTIMLPFTRAAVPVVDVPGGRVVVDRAAYDEASREAKPHER